MDCVEPSILRVAWVKSNGAQAGRIPSVCGSGRKLSENLAEIDVRCEFLCASVEDVHLAVLIDDEETCCCLRSIGGLGSQSIDAAQHVAKACGVSCWPVRTWGRNGQ